MRVVRSSPFGASGLLMMILALGQGQAEGQAVGFGPTVGMIPDGVSLNVTPVVSADRRYVRLSLAPQTQTITGFSTFPVPAAVAGGGNGGGLAGLGGAGGLGGLAGGGLRSIAVDAGPTDFAAWYPGLGVPRESVSLPAKPLKPRVIRSRKPLADPEIVPIQKPKPKPKDASAAPSP